MTAQRSWPSGVHRRRDEHRRYQRFLTTVGEQTGLDRDDSDGAAMATLATLAERISKARADELAEDLPERLRFWLADAKDAEPFHAFLDCVRCRADLDRVEY